MPRMPEGLNERNGSGDWKIELLAVPVKDIDRAKAFYVDQVGFHADFDIPVDDEVRFVQLTPPGSACSIVLDVNMTEMAAGSQKGIQVVVADADAARAQLLEKGVAASAVEDQPWGRFVRFSDPDGNAWALQEIPARD
jgi:catechol 2,3-dioxygenase-like lactoylglutathione lyase family enzyme